MLSLNVFALPLRFAPMVETTIQKPLLEFMQHSKLKHEVLSLEDDEHIAMLVDTYSNHLGTVDLIHTYSLALEKKTYQYTTKLVINNFEMNDEFKFQILVYLKNNLELNFVNLKYDDGMMNGFSVIRDKDAKGVSNATFSVAFTSNDRSEIDDFIQKSSEDLVFVTKISRVFRQNPVLALELLRNKNRLSNPKR